MSEKKTELKAMRLDVKRNLTKEEICEIMESDSLIEFMEADAGICKFWDHNGENEIHLSSSSSLEDIIRWLSKHHYDSGIKSGKLQNQREIRKALGI